MYTVERPTTGDPKAEVVKALVHMTSNLGRLWVGFVADGTVLTNSQGKEASGRSK